MKFDAIFFDFDGVLADSNEVKANAFGKLFEQYGPAVVEKVVNYHRTNGGINRIDKIRHYYKEFLKLPLAEDELTRLCGEFSRLVVAQVVASPEIPGAGDFLKRSSSQALCFVISGTPQDEMIEILQRRGQTGYFKEICGAPVKKKEHLEILLAKYELSPANCLFLGDARSDYLAAEACGTPFAAILPGPQAPLLQFFPDVKWYRDFYEFELYVSKLERHCECSEAISTKIATPLRGSQ